MAHSKSHRKLSFEMREALREQERREAPARLRAQSEAKLTIAFWRLRLRRGGPLWFYPTTRHLLNGIKRQGTTFYFRLVQRNPHPRRRNALKPAFPG